jgi:4-amino-4-deoxy-L-arabinose transferase-like glycosyltransferase
VQKSIKPRIVAGLRDYASKWPAPIIAGLFVFAWLAATSWMRPLSLPDEGRYVGVAWEMARSGNWLVPTLDTLPYFHKPPLFYWLTAGAISLFGAYEWAARLPTVLAASGAALALFVFFRRWVNEKTGRIAVLILVTMPFFFGGSQFANMDMLVAVCICLSILCAAEVVLAVKHNRPSHPLALGAAYLFAGLGLLAKGLIGIVIPAIVIGSWLIAMQQPRLLLHSPPCATIFDG